MKKTTINNHLADLEQISVRLDRLMTDDDRIRLMEIVDVMIFSITNEAPRKKRLDDMSLSELEKEVTEFFFPHK